MSLLLQKVITIDKVFLGTFAVENVPLITLFWPAMLVKGPLVE